MVRTGFGAGYLTGAGVAVGGFGLPDIGLLIATEMAERARPVVAALGGIPLIADADTGCGAPMNVVRTVRTVREYERARVAAIQLEDQAFPKKCGHLPDKELAPSAEFEAKLGAALDHAAPAPTVGDAAGGTRARAFARDFGIERFYNVGQHGICNQVIAENGLARPGEIPACTDSHTCAGGAYNNAARGLGPAEVYSILCTGRTWFQIAPTIRYE